MAAPQRELLEETGYVVDDWDSLGCFVTDGNHGCGKPDLMAARGARHGDAPDPGDPEEPKVLLMEWEDSVDGVRSDDVALLGSIAEIALAVNPMFARLVPTT